uniref:Mucin-5AC n=1 Tax=Gopherus evgoodei TaxID=1825980 RepID=A0A8C4Y9V5_9SAUR
MCLNYEVRVLCCEANLNCPTPTRSTATTTIRTPPTAVTKTTIEVTTSTKPPGKETPGTTTAETTPITTPQTTTRSSTTLPTTEIPTTSPRPTTPRTTTSSTTKCQPTCTWSKWFDVDFPSSGPKEGDIETYNNIRAAGEIICAKPANIECRAENHPDISIDQIGQVVQCNVNFGLMCKNEDQIGKFKMCFNYEIRVLCCEENINCPETTSILPTTPTRVTTPIIASTQTETTEVTMRTTHCFCRIEDTVYVPGEMIYNETDKDGCNFYAICSKNCSVERFKGPCKSTTPATPTPIPTTSTSIPTMTPTATTGETWKISNCTTATCEGNNKVVIQKVECPPVKKITCANRYPPVKNIWGFVFHGVCSGWGDPHYITFDGIYYTFLDNCTYTLVKQITPKYDNFRVDIDNYFCNAEDGLSCPQSIIVYYKYTVVVLTRELSNGVMANKIIFNKKVVNPGFQKDGISIYMLGINMVVEIPEIGATISFSGLIFSVKLPFSKFGNNTEGQCGTCTNTKTDDCRLPSGKIISSCTQMAPHWKVDDGKKQYCVGTPTATPEPSIPTPAPSCPPSALCKIILSEVFEECHKVIPPQDFYKGCVFDACHMTNTSMQCSSLEIYATLCATRGVCVDWRGETKGKCRKYCGINKYMDTCTLTYASFHSRAIQYNSAGLTEGCFCPEGEFLFNENSGVCVSDCHQWKSNCQDCVCDQYTFTVQCTKRPCKPLPPVSCDDPGFVPVQTLTQEDPCCGQTECRKNPLTVIPKGTCEKCTCSAKVEPESQRNIVDCQPIPCDTGCPVGYEYKMKTGQCCGECVQDAFSSFPFLSLCLSHSLAVSSLMLDLTPRLASPQHNGASILIEASRSYCNNNDSFQNSVYSLEANVMQHKCKCCQEVKTSKRQVTLSCPDGSTTDYSYIHVEQCDCAGTECIPQTTPTTLAQEQQQQQQEQEQIPSKTGSLKTRKMNQNQQK